MPSYALWLPELKRFALKSFVGTYRLCLRERSFECKAGTVSQLSMLEFVPRVADRLRYGFSMKLLQLHRSSPRFAAELSEVCRRVPCLGAPQSRKVTTAPAIRADKAGSVIQSESRRSRYGNGWATQLQFIRSMSLAPKIDGTDA